MRNVHISTIVVSVEVGVEYVISASDKLRVFKGTDLLLFSRVCPSIADSKRAILFSRRYARVEHLFKTTSLMLSLHLDGGD